MIYSIVKSIILHLFPLTSSLLCLFTGLVLLWFTTRRRLGQVFVTVGFLLLSIFSFPFLPDLLLGRLEKQYAPIKFTHSETEFVGVHHIVVLAGGHIPDPTLPITSQFTTAGLARLIEGIRLYKTLPGTSLILSGGPGKGDMPDAELMGDLAITLGIPRGDIILESKSMSTFEEAMLLRAIVKQEKFLLVTSASHMPRAMALFSKLDMNPVAVPTEHLVKKYGDEFSFMPSSLNLVKSDRMLYEFLALLKEKLAGRI